jgi:acyl-CoA reductase-like NAD-dependent aldehyde dehydrogenase
MARKVKVGLVNINGGRRHPTVPSGAHKQSGWGLESGIEAFTEMKSVVMGL